MTQWPPWIKHEEKVPHRLRTWRFSKDGPFWGAVLSLLVWTSVVAFLVSVALSQRTP